MTDLVSINGHIDGLPAEWAGAVSSSRLYGKGVFTTVAVVEGKPVFWEKHWRRLTADAVKLGVDISQFSETSVAEELAAIIEKNQLPDGRARLTFSDESPGKIWGGEGGGRSTTLTIVTGGRREAVGNIKLTVSPYRINTTSPLAGVKSCNYLEPLMAFEGVRAAGFDESVRLNERGEAASACMANIFWLKGQQLFTSSLKTGCLPGTTREFILENLECKEVEAGIEALREADDIFLTSAGLGVVQVAEFEGKKLRRADHPILRLLPF